MPDIKDLNGSQPWQRDNEVASDLLSLAGFDVTVAEIATWPDDKVKLAEEYAAAVHLSASDNDDVIVPECPDFLEAYRESYDRH